MAVNNLFPSDPADPCDPDVLIEGSKCFDSCIPQGMQMAVQTYLLAQIAGGSEDPATLMEAAKDFQKLPTNTLREIQVYLACQIAQAYGA
jgi:hypothetical protein